MASTDLVAGDATNNATYTGGNDGTMKLRVGPNGAKVDALTFTSGGIATFPQGYTGGGILKLATAQNTTSGTSIDFTGIPSWVKRITVMLNGVSTNGVSDILLRLGSGSIQSTGYESRGSFGMTGVISAVGFDISGPTAATTFQLGLVTLVLVSGNTWLASWSVGQYGQYSNVGGGNVTLSGTLDRIRLTTVNGTDTFDAGSVNILFEG